MKVQITEDLSKFIDLAKKGFTSFEFEANNMGKVFEIESPRPEPRYAHTYITKKSKFSLYRELCMIIEN